MKSRRRMVKQQGDKRKPATTLQLIYRFLPFLKDQKKLAFIAGIFMLASVILQLPLPLVTRYIIDRVLPNKNLALLQAVVFGLMGFMLIKGICDLGHGYFLTLFREKALRHIQIQLFEHVQSLDVAFLRISKPAI